MNKPTRYTATVAVLEDGTTLTWPIVARSLAAALSAAETMVAALSTASCTPILLVEVAHG